MMRGVSLPILPLIVVGHAAAIAAPSTPSIAPLPAGLPAGERYVLDNGLTVVLLPNDNNPYLDVQLGFRAGGGLDPAGKEGLATLLGRMLTTGIPGRDEAALAAELARLGGVIGADPGMESFVLGGHIPTLSDADVRRFLDIFVAMARDPTLPEALVEREKTLRLGLLRRLTDNPEALANIAAKLAAMGDGRRGSTGYGTPSSVGAITREDVADLHAALFVPRHAVLVVGGAFDPVAMRAYIAKSFGDGSGFGADTSAEPGAIPGRHERLCATRADVAGRRRTVCFDDLLASPPPDAPRARTVHVVIDDANLSQIPWRLTARNPVSMLDPRYPAFRLGTFVLGGEYTSWLNVLLRIQEGLTYGAYFQPAFGGHVSGAMMLTTDATPDALERSVGLGAGLVSRIATATLPDADLDRDRAILVNQFPFRFETIDTTVEQVLTLELASVPLEWLANWRDALARPSPSEVHAAMSPLDPAKMSLIVVGPAALAGTIAKIATGPVTTIGATALIEQGHL